MKQAKSETPLFTGLQGTSWLMFWCDSHCLNAVWFYRDGEAQALIYASLFTTTGFSFPQNPLNCHLHLHIGNLKHCFYFKGKLF